MPLFAFLEAFVGVGLFISGAILLSICTFLYLEQIATLQQMLPLAFLGALLSDHSGYYIGRSIGPRLHQTSFAIKNTHRLKKAELSIAKYGVFAIFIGRFLVPIRSLVPLVTGVSGMERLKYSIFDFIACATWTACLGLIVLGIDKVWD